MEININKPSINFNTNKIENLKYNGDINYKFLKTVYLGKMTNRWVYKTKKYNIHIGYYNHNKNLLNIPPINNIKFLYLCKRLILNKKLNHVILPIIYYDVDYDYIKKYPEFKNIMEQHKNFYFLLTYPYDTNLKNYLNNNIINEYKWKLILFQVIYTVYKLYMYLDKFCHNNLTIETVCINNIKKILKYNIDNKKYNIKCDFDLKFFNFDNSSLEITNNPYNDIHTFVNSIENLVPDNIKNFTKKLKTMSSFTAILNDNIFDEIKDSNI